MIHTKPLEELLQLCLWTAYLDDEHPQSLLLLSDVEGGKSLLTSQFVDNNGVIFPHDVTAFGILKVYLKALKEGKVKHIILPEFVFPLSRKSETVGTLLALLNGLMEEGVREIQTYATSISLKKPIYAGVIGCLARDEFAWRKNYWVSIGFLSRFLPVSYSYSNGTEAAIFDAIFNQAKNCRSINLKFHNGHVILPRDMAVQLKPLAKKIAGDCSKDKAARKLAGYRAQINLQRMAKACALNREKAVVGQSEINKIMELGKYINLDYNQL